MVRWSRIILTAVATRPVELRHAGERSGVGALVEVIGPKEVILRPRGEQQLEGARRWLERAEAALEEADVAGPSHAERHHQHHDGTGNAVYEREALRAIARHNVVLITAFRSGTPPVGVSSGDARARCGPTSVTRLRSRARAGRFGSEPGIGTPTLLRKPRNMVQNPVEFDVRLTTGTVVSSCSETNDKMLATSNAAVQSRWESERGDNLPLLSREHCSQTESGMY